MSESTLKKNINLKVGLYLQTFSVHTPEAFDEAMKIAKDADFDIMVFPEVCYSPFEEEVRNRNIIEEGDCLFVVNKCLELSREIGKALVYSGIDVNGIIYILYANKQAKRPEALWAVFYKHTMTTFSPLEFENYPDIVNQMFDPVVYKGVKLGFTICYDSNHALFSRMFGLNDVDVLINCTGGNVVYDKWYKYQQVRAIENQCYNFVTMGQDDETRSNSYVFGFNPRGKELKPINLMKETEELNYPGSIYVYDTNKDDKGFGKDPSINQNPTINKYSHLQIPVGEIYLLMKSCIKIADNIQLLNLKNENIVFCMVPGLDILKPERVLPLLYHPVLSQIQDKRYIIVNQHAKLDRSFYESILSAVLKVRAMENFVAVVLESDIINQCIQAGKNRTAQLVLPVNGYYGVDLVRTKGPDVIWQDKLGMRKSWRENIEFLVAQISKQKR